MRASDRVYETLLSEIQRGDLAPGAVLAEAEQAERLGVSRTPAREAITRLVADGLVTQLSPRVTVVSEFDVAEIRALFELRRALEASGARLAAQRGNPEVFAALAAAFRDAALDHDGAVDDYYALIARFDAAIDAAVGNPYFATSLRTIRTHLARARQLARDNHERLQQSVTEHQLIAQAIASGDPELAAHATHVHLHHALTAILASLAEAAAPEASPEDAALNA